MKRILLALFFVGNTAFSDVWEAEGYTVMLVSNVNHQTQIILADVDKNRFEIWYEKSPSEKMRKAIVGFKDEFYSWKEMKIKELKFVVVNNTMEIALIPASLRVKKVDYLPTVPSGLFFFYDKYLSYDFRMTKNNIFMKIKGGFYNKDELFDKMARAYANPEAYIRLSDPEFILAKIADLEKRLQDSSSAQNELIKTIDKLENELNTQKKQLDKTVRESEKALKDSEKVNGESLQRLAKDLKALASEMEESRKSISQVESKLSDNNSVKSEDWRTLSQRLASLNARLSNLESAPVANTVQTEELSKSLSNMNTRIDDIKKGYENLLRERIDELATYLYEYRRENENLKFILVNLLNKDSFWGVMPIDEKKLSTVVALKKKNPQLNKDELMQTVNEQGLNISGWEVYLILAVYFNEYD